MLSFICLFIAFILALSRYNHRKKNRTIFTMRQKIKANSFIDEPICKSILKTVDEHQFKSKVGYDAYKEFALSKEELAALKDAVDRHYNCLLKKFSRRIALIISALHPTAQNRTLFFLTRIHFLHNFVLIINLKKYNHEKDYSKILVVGCNISIC